MKKIILIALCLLFWGPKIASADPWLVCDVYPEGEAPDYFVVTFNGVEKPPIEYQEAVMSDGITHALLMDVANVPEGPLAFTAVACNFWEDCSDSSDPYQRERKLYGKPGNKTLKRLGSGS